MATATRTPVRKSGEELSPYRLTVRQFDKMVESGVLTEDDRVELLGGLLALQMTKNHPHNFVVMQLSQLLRDRVGPDWIIAEEKSLTLGQYWRPEPDLAVIRGPIDRYRKRLPSSADVALVVEVSDSTYVTDRGVKGVGYAGGRVPFYWIVNLGVRAVEVHSKPIGRGKTARYAEAATHASGAEVPVVVGGREVGKVAVEQFLP